MNHALAYICVMLSVAAICVGQILFKAAGLRLGSLKDVWHDRTALALVVTAYGIYAVSSLAWIYALRDLPLSRAYLFMSLAFVLVPVAAHFLFGEALTWRTFAGASLVVIGILVATV